MLLGGGFRASRIDLESELMRWFQECLSSELGEYYGFMFRSLIARFVIMEQVVSCPPLIREIWRVYLSLKTGYWALFCSAAQLKCVR